MYRGKNAVFKFIRSILKEYDYCRKMMKYFNKDLVTTAKQNQEVERFNICWICGRLIDLDKKVRDHCHITGKYRGAAHWNCKISKKVLVIFN